MSQNEPVRPLEQLGINPETILPEGVLTPAAAKAIRFTQAKPGYLFPEVEEFVDQAFNSLKAYAKLLHERDLDVHKLDEELGRATVDIRNKNSQIEVLQAQSSITQANVDDEELSTLLSNNKKLQEANLQLKEAYENIQSEYAQLNQRYQELNQWSEEAEKEIERLSTNQQEPLSPTANNNNTVEEEYINVEVEEPNPVFIEPQIRSTPPQHNPTRTQPQQNKQPLLPPGIRPEDLE